MYLLLEPGENAREAVRQLPAAVLIAAWRKPWHSHGVAPPARSVAELRRELEARVRQALKEAPRTQLVPVSGAAFELGVPERTLRARIARGALEASSNGRGELVLEVPASPAVRVPLPRSRPDPRILLLMALEGCQPGKLHRLGYRRRSDGADWREAGW